MSVALDACLVAESFADGISEHDAGVFDGVMGVYFDIAINGDGEVDEGVLGEEGKHVIEKGVTSFDTANAGAVEVETERDFRFRSLAVDS